eukprot:SAG22_NODE_16179_length_331_cov_0.866379_1_plen_36_part_01
MQSLEMVPVYTAGYISGTIPPFANMTGLHKLLVGPL